MHRSASIYSIDLLVRLFFFLIYFSQEATVQESVENLQSPYDLVERRNVALQSRMSGKKDLEIKERFRTKRKIKN